MFNLVQKKESFYQEKKRKEKADSIDTDKAIYVVTENIPGFTLL
jgi:hypothetical protein